MAQSQTQSAIITASNMVFTPARAGVLHLVMLTPTTDMALTLYDSASGTSPVILCQLLAKASVGSNPVDYFGRVYFSKGLYATLTGTGYLQVSWE